MKDDFIERLRAQSAASRSSDLRRFEALELERGERECCGSSETYRHEGRECCASCGAERAP